MGEPADPGDHRMDAPAGGALLEFLELLAHVQAWRRCGHRGPDEQERGCHAVDFGEQRAGPCRTLGRNDAHCGLDGEGDPEFGREGRQPVMPVREHEDLPVVAGLEELLGTAMEQADPCIGADNDVVVVEVEGELQGSVLGRVEVAEIEDQVGIEVAGRSERDEDLA